jgi:hypothetical protein
MRASKRRISLATRCSVITRIGGRVLPACERNVGRNGGDEVGEEERPDDDEDQGDGNRRLRYGIDVAGEEVPQLPTGNDPDGNADSGGDRGDGRCLPRDRGQLASRETE